MTLETLRGTLAEVAERQCIQISEIRGEFLPQDLLRPASEIVDDPEGLQRVLVVMARLRDRHIAIAQSIGVPEGSSAVSMNGKLSRMRQQHDRAKQWEALRQLFASKEEAVESIPVEIEPAVQAPIAISESATPGWTGDPSKQLG